MEKLLYMQSTSANDGKFTLKVYFEVGTNVDIINVNTQNRVVRGHAQLPRFGQARRRVGEESARISLIVIAINSPKSTYDAVFLELRDINLVDAIKRVQGVGR